MMIKNLIKKSPPLYRYLRFLFGYIRLHDKNFKEISKVIVKDGYAVSKKKKVLLAGLVGINPDTLLQTVLGLAFKRSNCEVLQLSCDSAMNLCFNAKSFHYPNSVDQINLITKGQGTACELCEKKSSKYSVSAKIKESWINTYILPQDMVRYKLIEKNIYCDGDFDELRNFTLDGLKLGQHAYSATVRFFANPLIQNEPNGLNIFKEYLCSAVKTALAFNNYINKNAVDLIVVDHGIYVPQGVITEISKKRGIKVVTFNTGYRAQTFLFAEGDSYHFAIPRSKEFLSRKYSDNQRCIANDYIKSRVTGSSDWVQFQPKSSSDVIPIDSDKINIAIFPNVLWDADIHFEEGLFSSSIEWIVSTLKYLRTKENYLVHLRIHPGEKKGAVEARYGIVDLLRDYSLKESTSLIIYDADNDINSYELAEKCVISVVYGSKMGIDLAALGCKVLTAGDCWTRNKSITTDPLTLEEYYQFLDAPNTCTIPSSRGIDFAYYLYFEKMYHFNFLSKRRGDPPFFFDSLKFENSITDKNSDLNRLMNELLS